MPAQCFYPDGTLSVGNATAGAPQLVPCDPNASASSCCGTGDTCFSNGLCMSTEFFYYRGGCTDKSWVAGACAKQCVSEKQTVSSSSVLDFFQVISVCQNVYDNLTPGGKLFTCSPLTSDCVHGNWTLTPANVTATEITGKVGGTSSSNSSSTIPASTVTVIPSSIACPEKGVSPAITGVAVAVPVVVISILALFFFFWERRKRVNAEQRMIHSAAMATNVSNSNSADSNNMSNHLQDLKQYVPIVEAGDGDINRVTELPASDGVVTRKPENFQWT